MGALSTFNDFMNATEDTVLTGPDQVLNEAVKNSYLLREFMRGREYTEVVQGGPNITDFIMFDEQSTYDHVHPGQTHVWRNPQILDNWSIPWRFAVDHMAWTDQELELQMGDGMSASARHRVLKRVKASKERRVVTSIINGLEDELFDLPNSDSMEEASGKLPYSIPALINEVATTGIHPNWTSSNKQGIAPGTQSKWVPQQVGYNNSGTATANRTAMIEAMDDMYYSVGFDTLPGYEGFGDASTNASMIVCSKTGMISIKRAMRENNDTYLPEHRQDPDYPSPAYSGIPFVYASNLDTAGIYPDGGSGAGTETTATIDGPRFYWLNRKYIKPVFHTKRYMYRHPVRTHPNQPSTHIQVVDCWHNYPVQSLQRHGIVYPNA